MSETKITTPHEFALANGWDFTCIEETAARGISEEDSARLEETAVTADALLSWCRARVAAATLGRRGGKAGTPAQLAQRRAAATLGGRPGRLPKVPCVACDAGGIQTMTSLRSPWEVRETASGSQLERVRTTAERPVCRSCQAQARHYPIAR